MKKYLGILTFVVIIIGLIIMYHLLDLLILLFALLFFGVLMMICVILFSKSLDVNVTIDNEMVHKNEIITLLFELHNRNRLAIPFYQIEIVAFNQFNQRKEQFFIEGSIASKQQKTERLEIKSVYSGRIHFNVISLTIFDYVKIFQKRKKINQKFQIYVQPNIYKTGVILDRKADYLVENSEYSINKQGNDALEIMDIRKYRVGDRLSRIHWKLTSKKQELMVKEDSMSTQYNTSILLDFSNVLLSRNINGLMDSFLEIALSLSNQLLKNKTLHYIVFFDSQADAIIRYPIDDKVALEQCIKRLLQIEIIKQVEDLYSLYQSEFMFHKQMSIIKITSDLEIFLDNELLFEIDRRRIEESLLDISFIL